MATAYQQPQEPRRATFEAFNEAWDLLGRSVAMWALCLFVLMLVMYAITLPVSLPAQLWFQSEILKHPTSNPFEIILSPAYFTLLGVQSLASALAMPFFTGFMRAGLRAFRGERPDVGMVFQLSGRYWPLVLYWVLHQFFAMILLVAFVIPGLVFYVLMLPASLLVVEQNLEPIEAMQRSAKAVWPSFWPVLGVLFVSSLAGMVGACACGVGVFFTAPIIYLAQAAVYRQLFEVRGLQDTAPPPPLPHPPAFEP